MQRSALEKLPRTTDIFDPPSATPSAAIDPVPAGYYPPLPIAVDRDDLPEALRTLLWGWGVVARLGRGAGSDRAAGLAGTEVAAAEVRTRRFEGDARAAVHLLLALEGRAGAYSLEEQRRL